METRIIPAPWWRRMLWSDGYWLLQWRSDYLSAWRTIEAVDCITTAKARMIQFREAQRDKEGQD